MQDVVLSILRGIRNGSYYGTKIRAPHGKWHCSNDSVLALHGCMVATKTAL